MATDNAKGIYIIKTRLIDKKLELSQAAALFLVHRRKSLSSYPKPKNLKSP